jgi:lipopolysaccharide biosynthesis glycosyltransferase
MVTNSGQNMSDYYPTNEKQQVGDVRTDRVALTCVYVTDRGFLPCTCFSIRTLVANASVPLDVYVLFTGDDPTALQTAERYLRTVGVSATFITVPAAAFADLPLPASLPMTTFGRLLMHRFLPQNLGRVLYIDGDTLVDIDVAPLLTVELHGAALGAVVDVGRVLVGRDQEARTRLDLGQTGGYFNAGVLLIDWPTWLRLRIGDQCLHALSTDPIRFTQMDQCALNYVCRRNWRQLEPIWNYQPADVIYAQQPAALFHFLGSRKPWQRHIRHPARFVQRYAVLFANSPWLSDYARPPVPDWLLHSLVEAKRRFSPRIWSRRAAYATIQTNIETPSQSATSRNKHSDIANL